MLEKGNFTLGENLAEKWLTELRNANEVIIYPAGVAGIEAYQNLLMSGVKINYFGDEAPSKAGTKIDGILVLDFQEIHQNHSDAVIVISTRRYYNHIFRQFSEAGFDASHLVMVDYSAFSPTFDQKTFLMERFSQYSRVYDWLGDALSQKIFLNLINYWLTFDRNFLAGIQSSSLQYFEKGLIEFDENEVFVDCGGFTGDTFRVFQQLCPSYRKYYFCEPDPGNFKEAQKCLPQDTRLNLVNKGLYDKETTLSFQALASGVSSVCREGTDSIEVTTIDQLVKGEVPPTFIKMDIEGSEYQALLGAKESIQTHKPKLAISVYHKPEDILLLPALIKKLEPSYQLYLRHYSISHTETICYAF